MKAKEYEIMLCKNGNLYINKAEGNDFRSSDSKAFTEEDYNQVKQWLTKSIWHDACEDPEENRAVLIITEYNEIFMSSNKPDCQGRGFSHYKKLSHYKEWAYVEDVLPIGCKIVKKEDKYE